MTFEKLSDKQKQVFKWCYKDDYKAIICDGAVRSGKTICMITSFILWAMSEFDGAIFGICGKTVRSAERNIIQPLQTIADINYYFKATYTRSVNLLTIEGGGHKNSFYVFGGRDESSYTLIQGITLSGIFLDEVALMPRSFVEQALARTLSVDNSKFWFNCNPDSPEHWFLKEWIDKADEKNAFHLHFTMHDNPILSAKQIENAESLYAGVFHDRYIKGLWKRAEGAIYHKFVDNTAVFMCQIVSEIKGDKQFIKSQLREITIGVDFGGNKSGHAFVATAHTQNHSDLIALASERHFGDYDSNDLDSLVLQFAQSVFDKYGQIDYLYYDNAETVLGRGLTRAFARKFPHVIVRGAKKYRINDRIQCTLRLMGAGRLFVTDDCKTLTKALSDAVWNSKKTTDERLDDGSTDIDSLDAFEYTFERDMKRYIGAISI